MNEQQQIQWHLVLAGLVGGVVLAKLLGRSPRPAFALAGYSRNPYAKPVSRRPRSAGERECIFGGRGTGEKCRFPVGTRYHERKALQYVQAGRCSSDECGSILSYLARHADDPEVRRRARQERSGILKSAKRAKVRRKRTRRRRK
jgi:hypothetical protein